MSLNEENTKPSSCGAIHYMHRTLMGLLGVDLARYDRIHDGAPEQLDVNEYWPVPEEFDIALVQDATQLIDVHMKARQHIEGLTVKLRAIALARLAYGLKDDPKLGPVAQLLALDAYLNTMNEAGRTTVRDKALKQALEGLFGGGSVQFVSLNELMEGADDGDVPPTGKKN